MFSKKIVKNINFKVTQVILSDCLSIPQCAGGRSLSDSSRNVGNYNISWKTKLMDEPEKSDATVYQVRSG